MQPPHRCRKPVAVKVTKSTLRKTVPWNDTYTQIIAFGEKQGHCRPHCSTVLGKWCKQQHANFQANKLSQDCIDKLATNGVQFCIRNTTKQTIYFTWNTRYNKLLLYKNKNGHPNPTSREGQLGAWCKKERKYFNYQMNQLTKNSGRMQTIYQLQRQIDKLAVIGFQFNLPRGKPDSLLFCRVTEHCQHSPPHPSPRHRAMPLRKKFEHDVC